MSEPLVEGWPTPNRDVLETARQQTFSALQDEERSADLLAAHYSRESNYAGATFVELNPNPPFAFAASDLLAVTMLSVEIPQVAVRRLLEPTPTSAHLSRLLSDDALDVGLNLMVAGPQTLAKMGVSCTTP